MSLNNFDSHGKRRILLNECKKVYIQRDYSQALIIRFSTEFPEELENYVSFFKFLILEGMVPYLFGCLYVI